MSRWTRFVLPLIALTATPVLADPLVYFVEDLSNAIPGTRSYSLMVNGDGLDWTAAAFKLDLTSGSVYNGTPDAHTPQSTFWPLYPELAWDTWFGIPGDATNAVAGGAGDVGGGALNVGGTGTDAISISWFDITQTDTSLTRIANITLTDDAVGSWALVVTFATVPNLFPFDGTIAASGNVLQLPEPGSLLLLGVCASGLLRRR